VTAETNRSSQAATMDEYKSSPYYQSLGIDGLQEQLAGYQADDETLRQQAEAQYKPAYEAELEAVRQELQRQVQSYDSQRNSVSAGYDRARRQANEAYDESAVDLNNALTKRGMGRSSLVSAQGAYLEKQRNQALADIGRDENAEISAINEKIALLTDQAAQTERTMAGNYARQLESRVNELKAQNQSASVSLQLQIAALQQQGYEAYQEWLKAEEELALKARQQALKEQEFEKKYPAATAGGGSGGSSGWKESGSGGSAAKATAQSVSEQAQKASSALATMLNGLREKLSSAKSGGTSGTGGTTAAKTTAAKRQAARE